ncbi:MAG TPA: GTP cyclohydrolase FolE2 [Candidatus Ozemobacteraceae bacterium]|nr:GTP cyclohydrolase FolE2 [Candidatus Ozemobacteraceae bacterium]HQG28048.1 GTP cyclohydrolase FolE2 [Candidatus Ozemobacteraceae bacterium]
MPLHDTQSMRDHRAIPLDNVGVTGLRIPITVLDRAQGRQETVAQVSLSVSLPHQFKGTHMSRFIEVLNRHRGEVTMNTVPTILADLKTRLDAEKARVEVEFPYFLEREAPVSRARALMDYECLFIGEANGNREDFILGVAVPVTSVCPCSKSISEYGAHNQRGIIEIRVRCRKLRSGLRDLVWIEELIQIAEESASAPVYPMLKRPDERHVTMLAYDNPAFVEDMVRNVAQRLQNDPRITWFAIKATNQESIHNHNAFAQIEWKRASASRKTT